VIDLRIVEFYGGPADGKIEAVSNNNCAEIVHINNESIGGGSIDSYLYKFDGFSIDGKLMFKYSGIVDEGYKYRDGFGPRVLKKSFGITTLC
jgi:hypothetical protein